MLFSVSAMAVKALALAIDCTQDDAIDATLAIDKKTKGAIEFTLALDKTQKGQFSMLHVV